VHDQLDSATQNHANANWHEYQSCSGEADRGQDAEGGQHEPAGDEYRKRPPWLIIDLRLETCPALGFVIVRIWKDRDDMHAH
jgi:hypothetical protein